jgi:hypothetical protein
MKSCPRPDLLDAGSSRDSSVVAVGAGTQEAQV